MIMLPKSYTYAGKQNVRRHSTADASVRCAYRTCTCDCLIFSWCNRYVFESLAAFGAYEVEAFLRVLLNLAGNQHLNDADPIFYIIISILHHSLQRFGNLDDRHRGPLIPVVFRETLNTDLYIRYKASVII